MSTRAQSVRHLDRQQSWEIVHNTKEQVGDVLEAGTKRRFLKSHPWARQQAASIGLPVVTNVLFYVCGVLFYTRTEGWSWDEAIYFLVVSSSTVGYGDYVPSTDGGKLATVLFMTVGIIVTFAQLASITSRVFTPIFVYARALAEMAFPQRGIDIDGDGRPDFKVPRGIFLFYSKALIGPFLVVLVIEAIFAVIFVHIEEWTYATSFYHCFVTSTSIGYGAPQITTASGRWCAVVQIVLTVSLVGAIISDIRMLSVLRKEKLHKLRLVQGQHDTDLMVALDRDGNGVDRFEFVIGMLQTLEVVTPDDVEPFLMLFERLDVDKSGYLTASDFEARREQNESEVQARALKKPPHATVGAIAKDGVATAGITTTTAATAVVLAAGSAASAATATASLQSQRTAAVLTSAQATAIRCADAIAYPSIDSPTTAGSLPDTSGKARWRAAASMVSARRFGRGKTGVSQTKAPSAPSDATSAACVGPDAARDAPQCQMPLPPLTSAAPDDLTIQLSPSLAAPSATLTASVEDGIGPRQSGRSPRSPHEASSRRADRISRRLSGSSPGEAI